MPQEETKPGNEEASNTVLSEGKSLVEESGAVAEEVFNLIWCPLCGCQSFVENRFERVRCMGCGVAVSIHNASHRDAEDEITVHFDTRTGEYTAEQGRTRKAPQRHIALEIEKTSTEYVVRNWEKGGEDWEPMPPQRLVRENPEGSSVPWKRWG